MSDSDQSAGKKKSDIKFLHDKRNVSISNGQKIVHEEYVIDSPKGLTIKFYHKEGDNFHKVTIKALDDGNYKFISSRNDEDRREEVLSKKDLLNELSKSKMLKFAVDYLDKQQGGADRYRSNGYQSRGSNRNGSRGSNRNQSRGSNRNGSRGSNRYQSRDNYVDNRSRNYNRSRDYMDY